MGIKTKFNKKGITLIELLVVFVISGIVIAGIYRVFVAQSKAYTVQDQVVEVQQNVRSAMEILLRDLRMAGYDNDSTSPPDITTPLLAPVQDSDITVSYEYFDTTLAQNQRHTVRYWRDAPASTLFRQITRNPPDETTTEALLENVDSFTLTYGIDTNDDGAIDNWIDAAAVGTTKVIAIRVLLTARPDQTNPDVQKTVSPRTLESIVILRNLCLIRY